MVQNKFFLQTLGFSVLAAFIIASYLNNNLFMDRLLLSSGIIASLMVFKTFDQP